MKVQSLELMEALDHKKNSLGFILIKKSVLFCQFCFSLYDNHVYSYLFVNGEEIFKFKADNKHVNFPP